MILERILEIFGNILILMWMFNTDIVVTPVVIYSMLANWILPMYLGQKAGLYHHLKSVHVS